MLWCCLIFYRYWLSTNKTFCMVDLCYYLIGMRCDFIGSWIVILRHEESCVTVSFVIISCTEKFLAYYRSKKNFKHLFGFVTPLLKMCLEGRTFLKLVKSEIKSTSALKLLEIINCGHYLTNVDEHFVNGTLNETATDSY